MVPIEATFTTWKVLTVATLCMVHFPLNPPQAQTSLSALPQEGSGEAAVRTQWEGVFTEDQAARGATLYGEYCASCHGADLAGDDRSPSLRGFQFSAAWDDVPLGQLFDRIRTSMPQDNPNSLTREQNADILAFILRQSNFPPGSEELSADSDVLNTIQFVMTRP